MTDWEKMKTVNSINTQHSFELASSLKQTNREEFDFMCQDALSKENSSETAPSMMVPACDRQNSLKRATVDDITPDPSDESSNKRNRLTTDDQFTTIDSCIQLTDSFSDPSKTLLSSLGGITTTVVDSGMDQLEYDQRRDLVTRSDQTADAINILSDGFSCLHDDTVQLHTDVSELRSELKEQKRQFSQMRKLFEETVQLLHASQLNNTILQTELESIRQTIAQNSHPISFDGGYLWKITDMSRRLTEAINDQQTSIYSPPFYTSPTGYKMCMRLYLHGDGQARKTHVSIFFVVMRGDHDALLPWPFTYKVTFCLYDQTPAQRHVIDSFRPDAKSNSFQRPRSNMNIASGIPKFLPVSVIQQDNNPYVRDNCMYIRCFIDFESLPKAIIPYVCGLNLGLPLMTQPRMIAEEVSRRTSTNVTVSEEESAVSNDKEKKLIL